ncbi:PTS glucose transporter subunit IIA [Rheinheimera gaetbuli]
MIAWHSTLSCKDGVIITSPLSGYVLPVTSHPDLLYNTNVLPAALCIQLTQGTLLAPFNGDCEFSLQYNRRVSIKHHSGLTLQVEFSNELCGQQHMRKQHSNKGSVVAGQLLLTFELPLVKHRNSYAVVMLCPDNTIAEIHACQRLVLAGTDPLLIIKNNTDNQLKE